MRGRKVASGDSRRSASLDEDTGSGTAASSEADGSRHDSAVKALGDFSGTQGQKKGGDPAGGGRHRSHVREG